jgi:hypothetical protein
MEVNHFLVSILHFEPFSSNINLHTRNLAFSIPSVDNMTEEKFIEILGTPELATSKGAIGKIWSLTCLNTS